MKKEFNEKYEITKKILLILITCFAFLTFAYASGAISWMQDIVLFVELLSSVLAVFIGVLALLRFYTRKSRLNLLLIGVGFLFVGVLEIVQILFSLNGFGSLFSYVPSEVFPLSMILSKGFLSATLFLSWFVRKDYENPNSGKEKGIYLGIIFLFVLIISAFLLFTNVMEGSREYVPAIIGGVLSMLLLLLGIVGYLRSRNWVYDLFEYWLIFAMIFLLISTIFFIPFLNLEYDLMIKFSVFARFFSYILMLIGFLVSIYEMYRSEAEYLEVLKKKNEQLIKTKNSVEEAYLLIRKEKWDIAKGGTDTKASKILEGIINPEQ